LAELALLSGRQFIATAIIAMDPVSDFEQDSEDSPQETQLSYGSDMHPVVGSARQETEVTQRN